MDGSAVPRRTMHFATWEELATLPPPLFLVEGMLPQCGVVLLYGESGCGKTFIAVALSCSVASGNEFLDLETQKGTVLYLAAEGYPGLAKRFLAWQQRNNAEIPAENLRACNDAPRLNHAADVDDLVSQLRAANIAPTLIVVDTLSTHYPGGDENSAKDVSLFLQGARRLADSFNCLIVIIHHTLKDGSNFRGSYALKANVDTLIKVDGPSNIGEPGTIACEKQRDSEAFEAIDFQLEKVAFGEPCDGNSSLVLSEAEGSTPDSLMGRAKPLTEHQKRVLDILKTEGPLSRKALLAKANIPDGSWRVVVSPLKVRGLLLKQEGKRGLWALSEANQQSNV